MGLKGDLGLRAMWCGCGQSAPEGPLRFGEGQQALSKMGAFRLYRCCCWSIELSTPKSLPQHCLAWLNTCVWADLQTCTSGSIYVNGGGSPASTEISPSENTSRLVHKSFRKRTPSYPRLLFQAWVFKHIEDYLTIRNHA